MESESTYFTTSLIFSASTPTHRLLQWDQVAPNLVDDDHSHNSKTCAIVLLVCTSKDTSHGRALLPPKITGYSAERPANEQTSIRAVNRLAITYSKSVSVPANSVSACAHFSRRILRYANTSSAKMRRCLPTLVYGLTPASAACQ